MFIDARSNKVQEKQIVEEQTDVDQTLFADYMLDWLDGVSMKEVQERLGQKNMLHA